MISRRSLLRGSAAAALAAVMPALPLARGGIVRGGIAGADSIICSGELRCYRLDGELITALQPQWDELHCMRERLASQEFIERLQGALDMPHRTLGPRLQGMAHRPQPLVEEAQRANPILAQVPVDDAARGDEGLAVGRAQLHGGTGSA